MSDIKGNYITIEEMPFGCVVNEIETGRHIIIGDSADVDLLIGSLQRLKADWYGDSDYEGLLDSVRKVDNFLKPSIEPQVVYKLRHIPTGLCFDPDGTYQTVSKEGKVYSKRKPPRQTHITIPYDIRSEYDSQFYSAQTKLKDWVVVEYELKEI